MLTQLICLTVNINRAEDAQPMRPEDFWPFGLPASIYNSGDEEGGDGMTEESADQFVSYMLRTYGGVDKRGDVVRRVPRAED